MSDIAIEMTNGNKHDQILWLLWSIIWLLVIVVDQLGVGL